MEHRHLVSSAYSLPAIDDVISRGGLSDWIALGLEARRSLELAERIRRIVMARVGDEATINHAFWRMWIGVRNPEATDAEGLDHDQRAA